MDSATAMEWVRGVGFPVLVAWYILRHLITSHERDSAAVRTELGKIRNLLTVLVERLARHEESGHGTRSGDATPFVDEEERRKFRRASTNRE